MGGIEAQLCYEPRRPHFPLLFAHERTVCGVADIVRQEPNEQRIMRSHGCVRIKLQGPLQRDAGGGGGGVELKREPLLSLMATPTMYLQTTAPRAHDALSQIHNLAYGLA